LNIDEEEEEEDDDEDEDDDDADATDPEALLFFAFIIEGALSNTASAPGEDEATGVGDDSERGLLRAGNGAPLPLFKPSFSELLLPLRMLGFLSICINFV